MTKYARLTPADDSNVRRVIETVETDHPLAEVFHPVVAEQFIQAPDATTVLSTKQGNTWTHNDPPEPVEVQPARKRVVDRQEFLMLISASTEAAIRAFPDAAFAGEGDDPFAAARPIVRVILNRIDTAAMINLDADPNVAAAHFMKGLGLLTQDEVDTLLAGPLA